MTKCAICRQPYKKWRITQKVCGAVECAQEYAVQVREKEARKAHRIVVAASKPLAWYKGKAQSAVNAYIRARDHNQPCISCGRWHDGQWHAGHYLSVGSNPELRYHLDNIHKQCAPCNTHKSGNIVMYRQRLIEKIGVDLVEWLEGPHPPVKYTREELQSIELDYKLKLKELCRTDHPVIPDI